MASRRSLPRLVGEPDSYHLDVLRQTPWTPYDAEGWMPSSWADIFLDRWKGFEPPLPSRRMCRGELLAYCRDAATPPLHAFIAIMAWGGQRARTANFRNAINGQPQVIIDLVTDVRKGMPRAVAYDHWRGKVPGLGPSFLTKILAFTCPVGSMAIMDQWVGKAINLLYAEEIVRLAQPADEKIVTSPSSSCTGLDYERYCLHLEDLQRRLGETTLSATEERIFSRHGQPWRSHVIENWKPSAASPTRRNLVIK